VLTSEACGSESLAPRQQPAHTGGNELPVLRRVLTWLTFSWQQASWQRPFSQQASWLQVFQQQ